MAKPGSPTMRNNLLIELISNLSADVWPPQEQ